MTSDYIVKRCKEVVLSVAFTKYDKTRCFSFIVYIPEKICCTCSWLVTIGISSTQTCIINIILPATWSDDPELKLRISTVMARNTGYGPKFSIPTPCGHSIFNSYVSLPEGIMIVLWPCHWNIWFMKTSIFIGISQPPNRLHHRGMRSHVGGGCLTGSRSPQSIITQLVTTRYTTGGLKKMGGHKTIQIIDI